MQMSNNFEDNKKTKFQSQFEAIFIYASEAIIIVNESGTILSVNPRGEELFGYEKNELDNETLEILIPKRIAEHHVSHRDNYFKKPKARSMGQKMDLWALKKDGSEFPVEISLSPYVFNNEKFTVAFIIDTSLRRLVEEKEKNYRKELEIEVENRTLVLKEAIKKLEKTKADLDESLLRERELGVLKSKFVSIASHEFRTPLSTILSSLSLVEKYISLGNDEKREKHIERIKKSIRSLTEILNDILSVNKLEEGKVIAQPEQFLLKEFITEIITEVGYLLKNGQSIASNLDFISEIELFQDPKLLRHILINLLSNSIKFSGENTEISITTIHREDVLIINVKDQGIGIPLKDQENLFQRFFRAENTGNIQGTGLGLSIVAQYLKLLMGDVSFKSQQNEGTVFTIKIPLNNSKLKQE